MLARESFMELARTWKYCGFGAIKFELVRASCTPDEVGAFIAYTKTLLETRTLDEVVGYMTAVLHRAYVPNVIEYTLTGGKDNG